MKRELGEYWRRWETRFTASCGICLWNTCGSGGKWVVVCESEGECVRVRESV